MKRSEVNEALRWAKALLEQYQIKLPCFGYWPVGEWRKNRDRIEIIRQTMLGWDVTDYGMNDFRKLGSVLFALRNGDLHDRSIGTPYAEKLIVLYDGQMLPTHFHYSKTEDIINRNGGVLAIRLYNANEDESIDQTGDVTVYRDGIKCVAKAGELIEVEPGNSITLTPRMYHSFGALAGAGDLIVGEVSSINDDNVDNRFNPLLQRFSSIEENEEILHPLCNEYECVIG